MLASLGIGVSGLLAAQRALDVTAHNMANVNTPGYSRQRIELVSQPPNQFANMTLGNGVKIAGITRVRDELLDAGARTALAQLGAHDARADALSRTERLAGTTEDGLSSKLSQLFGAWDDLARNPTSLTARSAVLNNGESFATAMRDAVRTLDQIASDSAAKLGATVDEVNALSARVADLNAQILDITTRGGRPNDLLDQRAIALDELARKAGATVRVVDNDQVDVMVDGGLLVSGTKASVLVADGDVVTWDNSTTPLRLGGEAGALIAIEATDLTPLRGRLDLLADGVRAAVNAVHAGGIDLNGDAGGDFFSGTGASDFRVAAGLGAAEVAASTSGAPADGNQAAAMVALRSGLIIGTPLAPTPPSLTAAQSIADLVAQVGRGIASAQQGRDSAQASVGGLRSQQTQQSGVNLDEELTNMLKYQHAYEAAARVITAADEMLDILINRTGLVGR
jgi:flagellar hook-associated protein 1 FlgK